MHFRTQPFSEITSGAPRVLGEEADDAHLGVSLTAACGGSALLYRSESGIDRPLLIVRLRHLLVAGVAQTERDCFGPGAIRSPGAQTSLGIDRLRDTSRSTIELASPEPKILAAGASSSPTVLLSRAFM